MHASGLGLPVPIPSPLSTSRISTRLNPSAPSSAATHDHDTFYLQAQSRHDMAKEQGPLSDKGSEAVSVDSLEEISLESLMSFASPHRRQGQIARNSPLLVTNNVQLSETRSPSSVSTSLYKNERKRRTREEFRSNYNRPI